MTDTELTHLKKQLAWNNAERERAVGEIQMLQRMLDEKKEHVQQLRNDWKEMFSKLPKGK